MTKVKYRKCPECGGKMVLRKSSKGRFWGCTMWKENNCTGSAEYYGNGAIAGLNITIREIENGYIVTTMTPFSGVDDNKVEKYVKSYDKLANELKEIFDSSINKLCLEIKENTTFEDEVSAVKHTIRLNELEDNNNMSVEELLNKFRERKDNKLV